MDDKKDRSVTILHTRVITERREVTIPADHWDSRRAPSWLDAEFGISGIDWEVEGPDPWPTAMIDPDAYGDGWWTDTIVCWRAGAGLEPVPHLGRPVRWVTPAEQAEMLLRRPIAEASVDARFEPWLNGRVCIPTQSKWAPLVHVMSGTEIVAVIAGLRSGGVVVRAW